MFQKCRAAAPVEMIADARVLADITQEPGGSSLGRAGGSDNSPAQEHNLTYARGGRYGG